MLTFSVDFEKKQNTDVMEELFLRLHNLRHLSVSGNCMPEGWILSTL